MADRTVSYRLTADIGQFRAQMAQASASVKDFADRATGATKEGAQFRAGLTHVGDTAGKVGLVAAAGLGAAVKASMDWESAWAGVTKTVDGSASQMAALEEQLREMARTMPATHQEIAAVAEAAGQLGVAREDVASFTETMIQLSETTNLTADGAATAIAQMANIMGTAGEDIDNLGAALVAVGNAGASTEAQIIQMSQGIAGAANVVGMTEAEVLGIANAVASIGIEVEAGGTAVSRVLTDMAKSVSAGGEKLETFAAAAGVSAEDFARAFEERPAEALTMFVEGLGRINDAGGDVFGTLDQLGMSDVRVSRALLGMAADSEKFAGSLDLASEAWTENTALAEEYAKRLDTTAAQSQIAWNNIKDAAIDVGDSMLPVVEGAARSVAQLAQAFQQLPGPVKGAVGPMLGITAVLGGGLWFTAKAVNGVADMRKAMADLGPAGTRAATAMGKVGRAASIAAAGLSALAVVDAIQSDFDDTAVSVEGMTKALLGLDAAKALPDNLKGLGDQLERLADPNWAQNLQTNIADVIGFGDSDELYEARATIEAIDAALMSMVQSGNADTAASQLDAVLANLSDKQASYLLGLLPQYDEALLAVENDAKLAADGTDAFGGALDDAADGAESLKDAMLRLNAVLEGRAGLRDYQAALDDFTESMKENGRTFDINTEKGRANQAALDNIASSALNVADNLEGAARRDFLTGAIRDIRTFGRDMDLPKSETRALIALLREANAADVDPDIDADTTEANRKVTDTTGRLSTLDRMRANPQVDVAVRGVEAAENQLSWLARQRSATIWVRTQGSGAGPQERNADGGTIGGQRHPYGDKVLSWLAPGEEVISNRYGQADRHRELLKAINANRLADGGTVGAMRATPAAYAGGGTVAAPLSMAGLHIVGTLETPFGPAEVRGVVQRELAERDRTTYARRRAS